MADQLRAFEIDGQIVSIDILPPTPTYQRSEIRFLLGDAGDLAKSLSPELLASLPHPWLVIEDASHRYDDTLAVLRFFDPMMRSGEYLVIEDGDISEMGRDDKRNGGPLFATSQFLSETSGRYAIDESYCDQFGHNVTGNPNGYLRKL